MMLKFVMFVVCVMLILKVVLLIIIVCVVGILVLVSVVCNIVGCGFEGWLFVDCCVMN